MLSVQIGWEAVVGSIGYEATVVLLSIVAAGVIYWTLFGLKQIVVFATPRALTYAEGEIDRKTRQDYRNGGRSFDGFTLAAWKIGIICALIVYAVIWIGKHFPALWLLWFGVFAAAVGILSVVGYMRSGQKMTVARFVGFYAPTASVVVQQLP